MLILDVDGRCPKGTIARMIQEVERHASYTRLVPAEEGYFILTDGKREELSSLLSEPSVRRIVEAKNSFPLASTELWSGTRPVEVAPGLGIGKDSVAVIAGPCAVESREQILASARAVQRAGAVALRGGAFKPRSNPYTFQGLAGDGVQLLCEARADTGLPIVTEVMEPDQVGCLLPFVDVFQVGARNMQNFPLLKELGKTDRPVVLKRGLAATVDEWLQAAEYILAGGNFKVILCERGIRTFETRTRNTLDLSVVPLVKGLSHLPIVVDPSHGTGHRPLVVPMALAALAAGADGLMMEVHPDPRQALSDGPQSLTPQEFAAFMPLASGVLAALGRTLAVPRGIPEARQKTLDSVAVVPGGAPWN